MHQVVCVCVCLFEWEAEEGVGENVRLLRWWRRRPRWPYSKLCEYSSYRRTLTSAHNDWNSASSSGLNSEEVLSKQSRRSPLFAVSRNWGACKQKLNRLERFFSCHSLILFLSLPSSLFASLAVLIRLLLFERWLSLVYSNLPPPAPPHADLKASLFISVWAGERRRRCSSRQNRKTMERTLI